MTWIWHAMTFRDYLGTYLGTSKVGIHEWSMVILFFFFHWLCTWLSGHMSGQLFKAVNLHSGPMYLLLQTARYLGSFNILLAQYVGLDATSYPWYERPKWALAGLFCSLMLMHVRNSRRRRYYEYIDWLNDYKLRGPHICNGWAASSKRNYQLSRLNPCNPVIPHPTPPPTWPVPRPWTSGGGLWPRAWNILPPCFMFILEKGAGTQVHLLT